jgi:uncharacterized protein (TIGR03435 family)
MTNATLITCMRDAYKVYAHQISAPAWMDSTRYDITAKASDPVSTDQLRRMLQTLLVERFHLMFHDVRKELNVYSLAPGRNGLKSRKDSPTEEARRWDGGISGQAHRAMITGSACWDT